jgi:hypothetical protein
MKLTHGKMTSLWLITFILLGCGGGGSSSDNGSKVATPAAQTPSENIEIEPEAKEEEVVDIQSLIIADDFTFTMKENVQVNITLSEYINERAYVSVYQRYQLIDSEQYYAIADSRVLGGALTQGEFNQSFVTLNNQEEYLVEVWFYDNRAPLQRVLYANNNSLTW